MSQTENVPTLLAGVARADITPPVGIKSAGYAARGPLTRFHDSLLATALVLSDGAQQVALLSCDLLGLDAETVKEIRQQVQARTGLPEGALTVACTHTHYGPDPCRELTDPQVRAYRANLIHTLVGIVAVAAAEVQPARLRVGWGMSSIGVNRREKLPDGRIILGQNPTGPIDRAVGVARLNALSGEPLACIVNFQTHPVSQTGEVAHISADYPGKMRDVVETLTGASCLFLQGACGNINALRKEPHYESARSLGVRLGCEVVRLWEICGSPTAIDLSPAPLRVTSKVIGLPRMRYGSRDAAAALVADLSQEIEQLSADPARQDGRVAWAQRRLQRAQQALESWETGTELEPVSAEVQAWCVGDFALVTAPGEIFNQIGARVKTASPFAHTFFVGYANGSIGYVPVPEAYPEGGYEVTHASQVAPDAAALLTETCDQLLRELTDKDTKN